MSDHTKQFLMDIIEFEKQLLSGTLRGVARCYTLISMDNREKALIDIHGEEKYGEMLEELKFERQRN